MERKRTIRPSASYARDVSEVLRQERRSDVISKTVRNSLNGKVPMRVCPAEGRDLSPGRCEMSVYASIPIPRWRSLGLKPPSKNRQKGRGRRDTVQQVPRNDIVSRGALRVHGERETELDALYALLSDIRIRAGDSFSGLGVLVCDRPETLPVLPLRPLSTLDREWSLTEALVEISDVRSEYHDGFHVISSNWVLSKISQYFSPPIVNVNIDRRKIIGARYITALFGSAIENIHSVGIAGKDHGIVIFENGVERYSEGAI